MYRIYSLKYEGRIITILFYAPSMRVSIQEYSRRIKRETETQTAAGRDSGVVIIGEFVSVFRILNSGQLGPHG